MKKVMVFAGGKSKERDVSLRSGTAVAEALVEAGFAVKMWDPAVDIITDIFAFAPDAVFIAMHGRYGEDGCIQGFLETLGIPYTGSDVETSAICMNKQLTKKFLAYENLPTAPFVLYEKSNNLQNVLSEIEKEIGYPVIVKPANEGSSIGTVYADNQEMLKNALIEAETYDSKIVIERYIKGTELTVAIIGNPENPTAFPIIEIAYNENPNEDNPLWNYEAKYTPGMYRHIIPARLTNEVTVKIQSIAIETYKRFNCRGFARVDFMLDHDNNPYILEINTIPGCTATSLFPDTARIAGISFPQLVKTIIDDILE